MDMDNSVLISQVNLRSNEISFMVESKYAYWQANLKLSFGIKQTKVISVETQSFDLFEGKQKLSIKHGVSNTCIKDLLLTIEINDQYGCQVGYYIELLNSTIENDSDARALIESSGELIKLNEGGCFRICVGGVTYRIHARYNGVFSRCKDYLTKKDPDYDISISDEEILNDKETLKRVYNYSLSNSEIEEYAVRNKVSESIINYNGFQMHGAAIAVDNQCYIFTADSGIGKTTHIRMWLKHLENAYVVNGDHPIIKAEPDLLVYGSPWCGKEGMNTNTSVPLKAIIIMERSSTNEICETNLKEVVIDLIRQVYKSSDPANVKKTLELVSSLDKKVKFYKFRFNNFADDAFRVPYEKIHINR